MLVVFAQSAIVVSDQCNLLYNGTEPCVNGGICVPTDVAALNEVLGGSGKRCMCPPDSFGESCEKSCAAGFFRDNGCNYCDDPDVICHEEINACDGFPCQNNGACTDELKSTTNSVDGRSCECKAGFNGTSCENSSGMFATAPLVVVLCLIYTLF